MALGSWLGVWLGRWLVHTPLAGSLAILLLALVFFTTIVVHEAGHWLGSYYAKLRCYSVSVLWLHLERRGPRWHFELGKRRLGTYGHVKAIPVQEGNLIRQMALFIAAGPAASLLAGLLALGAGWWGRSPAALAEASQGRLFILEGLWLFGWWSLFTGLKNLYPFTISAGTGSDGKMLYQLYQGGPELVQQHATLRLTAASYQGVRPRHWDARLLAVLLEAPPHSALACSAHTYAYMHYLDAASLPTARQHLTQALACRQVAHPQLQQQLCCEAAYLALVHDQQPGVVADWLAAAEQAKPLGKEQRQFAAVLVACGVEQWANAHELLQTSAQEIARLHDAGGQFVEADRLRELSAFIEQRRQAAYPALGI